MQYTGLFLPACLLLLALSVSPTLGCQKVIKPIRNVFKSRLDTVPGPSCFTLASMRTLGDSEGTYDTLEEKLGPDSCRQLCKDKGHKEGQIIGLTPGLCHCNKNFKRTGVAELNKCTDACPGSEKDRCGGPDFVSAYPANP